VTVLLWPAPHTYTGQDLVELHTIGSPPLIEAILSHFYSQGARPAQPGEFTMRAFLAGKLDLTQAEAVLAVIDAETTGDLHAALGQLAGGIGKPLQQLRDDLLALLAEIEAGLDFAEEDLRFIPASQILERLQADREVLGRLEQQLDDRGIAGRPFRVVLAGPPNVGKSSLFNALVGDAAALVSPQAGATRDYLVRRVCWQDVELELVDTAGEADVVGDAIGEQAQAARSEQAEAADLVVHCEENPEARRLASGRGLEVSPSRPVASGLDNALCVGTKCDLVATSAMPETGLQTSAVTGQGIEDLREELVHRARSARRGHGLALSASRCRQHVRAARERIEAAIALASHGDAPELLALELRLALDEVGELVGAVYTDDLLDRIFSQFCIGK
jgi:tRNA modification GTPase